MPNYADRQLEVICYPAPTVEQGWVTQVGWVYPIGTSHGITPYLEIEPCAEGRTYLWRDNLCGCVTQLAHIKRANEHEEVCDVEL